MRKTTKDLSTHQLMYILFLTSMIYSIIFIPNRIITLTGRDMWITIVFFVLLNIFHVVIFYICIKLAPNLTLNEILEKTLGKVISKIILAGFGIYLFIRLAIMLSDFGLYTNDVVFSNNWQPVVLPVIIVGGFCAYSGLRSSSRMIEVLGAGIIIVMIITIFAVIASSDLTNILPILNSGFKPVLNGFSNYLFYAGDYLGVICFLGRIKIEKKLALNIAIPIIASAVFVIMFAISYYGFYQDIAVFQKQGHSLIDMSQHLLGSESLARFDFVISIIWMAAIIIRIFLNMWVLYSSWQYVFGLSQKPVHKYILVVGIIILLNFAYSYYSHNTTAVIKIIETGWRFVFILPYQFLLYLLLPFLTYIANKKEKQAQENNMLFKKPAKDANE